MTALEEDRQLQNMERHNFDRSLNFVVNKSHDRIRWGRVTKNFRDERPERRRSIGIPRLRWAHSSGEMAWRCTLVINFSAFKSCGVLNFVIKFWVPKGEDILDPVSEEGRVAGCYSIRVFCSECRTLHACVSRHRVLYEEEVRCSLFFLLHESYDWRIIAKASFGLLWANF